MKYCKNKLMLACILADEKLFNKYKNYYVRNVVCLDNYKVLIILTKQRDL